jgi:hypothetical protein
MVSFRADCSSWVQEGRYKYDDFLYRVVFVNTTAERGVRVGVSYTVLCGRAALYVLYNRRSGGVVASWAAHACIIAIAIRRCISMS